jgi:multidrug efflux system membrane fusion protein
VFVSFAVPARLLPSLREDRSRGALRVRAVPAGSEESAATGTVTFFDNAIDPATDTIRLKATFPNRDGRLWPGAFVDVTLERSIQQDAVVIPNAAVQASQAGQMVFVVQADDTVEARPVTIGWTEGTESVIDTGLAAGETVVTDGHLRLTPGAKVAAQAATAPREDERR